MNWLDHVTGPVLPEELTEVGYVDGFQTQPGVWRHPGAQLPAIIPSDAFGVALRVDDVVAFAHAQESLTPPEGSARAGFRRATVSAPGAAVVIAGVERRSWGRGISPQLFSDAEVLAATKAWALWDERPRANADSATEAAAAVAETVAIAEAMVKLVGADLAAAYVLEIERIYWQRRNTAGALQHSRQDHLGLGWGNNDHHTFRSSRPAFQPLIQMFNALGFVSREKFYAGEQAGWGAQVLEHPGCGGVLFTDVDLGPDEIGLDFASTELPELGKLGTVGVWCALHGESILSAGMHHLEGQFEFDALRADLTELGFKQMKPFSEFEHLRQAFTQAERWPVAPTRLATLVAGGHMDQAKADEFAANGAAGSHLENLQRRQGLRALIKAVCRKL